MAFLLGSTWLALHIWVTEHWPLLAVAPLCALRPAVHRRHPPVRPAPAPTP